VLISPPVVIGTRRSSPATQSADTELVDLDKIPAKEAEFTHDSAIGASAYLSLMLW